MTDRFSHATAQLLSPKLFRVWKMIDLMF